MTTPLDKDNTVLSHAERYAEGIVDLSVKLKEGGYSSRKAQLDLTADVPPVLHDADGVQSPENP